MHRQKHPPARGIATIALLALLAAACDDSSEPVDRQGAPVLTAATLGPQAPRSYAEYLAEPRYAAADQAQGTREAQICRACHSLEKGGRTLIGPNLYGMFGQPAGQREDYDYSQVLMDSDFVWTPRAMEAWLAEPARFLPGNRMSFAGVADEQRRVNLVAYLLAVTGE